MKAIDLIELAQNVILSIPTLDDRGAHEEIVRAALGRAYNQMLGDLTIKGYKNLSPYTKLYKNVAISLDASIGAYYSELPVDISPLVDVKSGVRGISPMIGTNVQFAPLDREKLGIIGNLLVSQVSTKIGYTIGINSLGKITVDYFGMNTDNVISEVKMYLLIPFEAYGDQEEVHIPAGQDKILLDYVVKFLSGSPQKDLKNSASEMKY